MSNVSFYCTGAFTRCLKLLYEDLTGRKLEVTNYGKPNSVTYKYVLTTDRAADFVY